MVEIYTLDPFRGKKEELRFLEIDYVYDYNGRGIGYFVTDFYLKAPIIKQTKLTRLFKFKKEEILKYNDVEFIIKDKKIWLLNN